MNTGCVNKVVKKSPFLILICGLLAVLCSCGYQLGSIMHPQIKTVAIAPVQNETMEVTASAILRGLLAERFQFDNSLKVVSLDQADCVVYARIKSVQVRNVVWSSSDADQNFRPSLFQLTAEVEYTVRIPGQSEPLINSRTASGSALYQYTHDPILGKRDGMKQAFLQAADRIVQSLVEGW